jgi:hypothetical protein
MPNWKEILDETNSISKQQILNLLNEIRNKYLSLLQEKTKRNVIAYYSDLLHKDIRNFGEFGVTDLDQNSFMTTICNLEKERGLDPDFAYSGRQYRSLLKR